MGLVMCLSTLYPLAMLVKVSRDFHPSAFRISYLVSRIPHSLIQYSVFRVSLESVVSSNVSEVFGERAKEVSDLRVPRVRIIFSKQTIPSNSGGEVAPSSM